MATEKALVVSFVADSSRNRHKIGTNASLVEKSEAIESFEVFLAPAVRLIAAMHREKTL